MSVAVACEPASPSSVTTKRKKHAKHPNCRCARRGEISQKHAERVSKLEGVDPHLEARLLHQTSAWKQLTKGARHFVETVRAYLGSNVEACPSQEFLAEKIGCDPRTIRTWAKHVAAAGILCTRLVLPGEPNALGQIATHPNVHYSRGTVLLNVAERAVQIAGRRSSQPEATPSQRERAPELGHVQQEPPAAPIPAEVVAAAPAPVVFTRISDPPDPTADKGVNAKEEALTSPSLSDPFSLLGSPPAPQILPLAKAGERGARAAQSERGAQGSSAEKSAEEKDRSRERQRLALDVVLHHQRTHYPDENPPLVPLGGVSLVLSRLDEGWRPAVLKNASTGAFRAHGPHSIFWMYGPDHALSEHEHSFQVSEDTAAADLHQRLRAKLVRAAQDAYGAPERPEDVRAILAEDIAPPAVHAPELAPELRRSAAPQERPPTEPPKVEPFRRWEPSHGPAELPDWLRELVDCPRA